MSQLFKLSGQSIGTSVSESVLPMNTQDWFPLGLACLISLQSKRFSGVFSSTIIWKHLSDWLSFYLYFISFFSIDLYDIVFNSVYWEFALESLPCIQKCSVSPPQKKWIWVSCIEVDEPRAWYTEWSEKENQILYINTCIWNLEEWYWWTYLQGRDRDTNVESVVVDTVEEGKGGMNWELHWHTYTITCKINREGGSCVGEGIQLQALCSVMT